jgi:hypothetical protein
VGTERLAVGQNSKDRKQSGLALDLVNDHEALEAAEGKHGFG